MGQAQNPLRPQTTRAIDIDIKDVKKMKPRLGLLRKSIANVTEDAGISGAACAANGAVHAMDEPVTTLATCRRRARVQPIMAPTTRLAAARLNSSSCSLWAETSGFQVFFKCI